MARTVLSGPLAVTTKETDGSLFIPGSAFMFDVGTWTLTRDALGNYKMRKTAAANVSHPAVNLMAYLLHKTGVDPLTVDSPGSGELHDLRGIQITSIRVIYGIGTAALNTHGAFIGRIFYVNGVAPAAITAPGLVGTLATATAAQPYVTTLTPASPHIIGNNFVDITDVFELTVDAALTSVYDLYGLSITFSYNLL